MDHKYLFTNMGYNLKPLDLQGAIGIAQMEKVEDIEKRRKDNFKKVAQLFDGVPHVHVASKHPKADPCWFGVPLVCDAGKYKESLVAHLETNLIQTRSYFAGNILLHPGYKHLGDASKYPNANEALKRVFFLGCPPHYTEDIVAYIGKVLRQWSP